MRDETTITTGLFMKRILYFTILLATITTAGCNEKDECTGTKPSEDCFCHLGSWECEDQCTGDKPADNCTCKGDTWECPGQCAGNKPADNCTCDGSTWKCPGQCEGNKPADDCTCNGNTWECPGQCEGNAPESDCSCENGNWNCNPERECLDNLYGKCDEVLSGYTCDKQKKECNCNGVLCDDPNLVEPICTIAGCKSLYVTMNVELTSDDAIFVADDSSEINYHVSFNRPPKGTVSVEAHVIYVPDQIVCVTSDGTNKATFDENNWETGVDFKCRVTDWPSIHNSVLPDSIPTYSTPLYFYINANMDGDSYNDSYFNINSVEESITIVHSLTPEIIVSTTDAPYTNEDGSSVTMNVHLGSYVRNLKLNISIENDDGTESAYGLSDIESIEFSPGEWKTDKTITITGQDDGNIANTTLHGYKVKITPEPRVPEDEPDAYADPYFTMEPVSFQLYNLDNDTSNVLTDTDEFTVTESGVTAEIGVKLPIAPIAGATVNATIEPTTECMLYDGTDTSNHLRSATLNFTRENYDIFQSIHIVGIPDGAEDGDKECILHLKASSEDESTPYNGLPLDITGTNLDNGFLGMTASLTKRRIHEYYRLPNDPTHPIQTTLQVSLNQQPESNVTLAISAQNAIATDTDTHVSLNKNSLTFTPDNYNAMQTVIISGVRDYKDTANRIVKIVLNAVSDDTNYNGIEQSINMSVINIDNAGISISYPGEKTLYEYVPDGSQPIQIKLATIPSADVVISAESSNSQRMRVGKSTDPQAASDIQTITITPETWNEAQTLYVFPVDDYTENTANSATLNFTATSDDTKYHNMTKSSEAFTIVDDDFVHNISISCSAIGCAQYGESNVSCSFSLRDYPKDLDTVNMSCTISTDPNASSILPSESVYNSILRRSSGWSIRKTYTTPMSSPCCGTENTVPSEMTVRTFECTIDDPKFKASGTRRLNMEFRPGYCSWAHD